LKQNKLKNDADLMALKFSLIKRLKQNNTDTATIYAMLEFINIYLPFADSEKEPTFEREIDLFIDKEDNMEALTIRQLYDRKIREDGHKRFKKEEKLRKFAETRTQEAEYRAKEEARMRQEEARMRQEEARMRQEEARMRQEVEDRLAAISLQLYSQGTSVERIAEMMATSVAVVQKIIDSAQKN
jgi:septin family protein